MLTLGPLAFATPWMLAGLAALPAIAEPLWNPAPRIAGSGPLLIVTDNGWAAASHWTDRRAAMDGLIAEASRADRPVLVVGTAPEANPPELTFEAAGDADARARAMEPNVSKARRRSAAASRRSGSATGSTTAPPRSSRSACPKSRATRA